MATFLANEINTTERDIKGPRPHVQIVYPLKDNKKARYLRTFFLECKWVNNQRKLNSVWCITLYRKIIELICCARRILNVTKSCLNICICQHCGVETNTVTPSFYYVFKISLPCYNSIRSFIRNLWRVLLLGSHLKSVGHQLGSFARILVAKYFSTRHGDQNGRSLERWLGN